MIPTIMIDYLVEQIGHRLVVNSNPRSVIFKPQSLRVEKLYD